MSFFLPAPSMMVVLSLSIWTRLAVPTLEKGFADWLADERFESTVAIEPTQCNWPQMH
jgi:hypothetical protein